MHPRTFMHMTIVEFRSLPKELSINVTPVVLWGRKKGKKCVINAIISTSQSIAFV